MYHFWFWSFDDSFLCLFESTRWIVTIVIKEASTVCKKDTMLFFPMLPEICSQLRSLITMFAYNFPHASMWLNQYNVITLSSIEIIALSYFFIVCIFLMFHYRFLIIKCFIAIMTSCWFQIFICMIFIHVLTYIILIIRRELTFRTEKYVVCAIFGCES